MRVDQVIFDPEKSMRRIIQALRGNLVVGENVQVAIMRVADTGVADTAFFVDHNLQRDPVGYWVNIDRAGVVYDGDRSTWNSTQIQLRCSVPHAVLTVIVF